MEVQVWHTDVKICENVKFLTYLFDIFLTFDIWHFDIFFVTQECTDDLVSLTLEAFWQNMIWKKDGWWAMVMISDDDLRAMMILWSQDWFIPFPVQLINEVTLLWAVALASRGRVLHRGEALAKFLASSFISHWSYAQVRRRFP